VEIEGRGTVANFTVYGYFNRTDSILRVNGTAHYSGAGFAELWEGLQPDTVAAAAGVVAITPPPPPVIQLQVELQKRVKRTMAGNAEQEVDPVKTIQMWNLLMGQAATYCNFNLSSTTISMTLRGGNGLTISSRAISPTTTMVAKITLSDDLSRALQWPVSYPLTFPLNEDIKYELTLTLPVKDSLAGCYPVTTLLHGYGEARNWIHGRGYCSVLAVLRENTTPLTEPIIFETDCYNLRLEFVDSSSNTITFKDDAELNLIMHFSLVS
jgi:hypothetical protein